MISLFPGASTTGRKPSVNAGRPRFSGGEGQAARYILSLNLPERQIEFGPGGLPVVIVPGSTPQEDRAALDAFGERLGVWLEEQQLESEKQSLRINYAARSILVTATTETVEKIQAAFREELKSVMKSRELNS